MGAGFGIAFMEGTRDLALLLSGIRENDRKFEAPEILDFGRREF